MITQNKIFKNFFKAHALESKTCYTLKEFSDIIPLKDNLLDQLYFKIIKTKLMEKNLEETVKEFKNSPGKVRGETFRTLEAFIIRKEGKEGVEEVERKMKELGIPIKLNKISSNEWKSNGLNTICSVVAKELFNWTEEDIFELGKFEFKTSFILKIVLSYFTSFEKALEALSKYWRSYHDFGSLEKKEFNAKEKYAIIQKKEFKTHPLFCNRHRGYMYAGASLVLRTEELSVKEIKCMHEGDCCHEYIITWK